ncbi:alpha/beta fold hydrolase [Mucilaginibacter psychrotolerans]|uniref:Alpha/beta hydrolase n=1 Tax=Mucilaginibacter psychrotolerans TaxID=1524096 RepID=A0A4Y8SFP6_9SPHI|nr:alpha/beta hydrolase [Mucilaginibacter psychrotolerans]TFF37903.1 alpha/beta hydrolase [Mucilaginibacter psychrotolerans]
MKALKLLSVVLLVLCAISASAQQKETIKLDTVTYGKNAAVGKYAEIRGMKMYYEVYGKGEPLLIIHGNGGSIKDFRYQIPYFAKKYQVILADSRAQGKSNNDKDTLSYEMLSDDLNALLDKLNIKNANVIGWSDGGIEGLLLAMRNPDKVKMLAVTGANLWPDSTAVYPYIQDYILKQNVFGADSVKRMKNPTRKIKDQLLLLHLLSYEPHIKTGDLHKIACPTLVIGGDHDVIQAEHTMLIAKNIPKSYLWILPNSGHSTPIYYRDTFNQVIGDFFSKPYRKIENWDVLK